MKYEEFCEHLESYAVQNGFTKEFIREVEFRFADHLTYYKQDLLSLDECKLGFLASCLRWRQKVSAPTE